MASLRVPGVPWHPRILADQLTLPQPGGTYYAHLITTVTTGFSDLPAALKLGRAVREICACAEQRIFRTCLRRRRRGYDGGTQWIDSLKEADNYVSMYLLSDEASLDHTDRF